MPRRSPSSVQTEEPGLASRKTVECGRLGHIDVLCPDVIPGPKFRFAADLLRDRQEDILVGNEALPS